MTTNDDVNVIVPNTEFINNRVINWTYGSPYRRVHVPFGSDKEAVKAAVLRAAASLECTVTDLHRKSDIWLINMGESSLDFELIVWVGSEATDFPARIDAAYK